MAHKAILGTSSDHGFKRFYIIVYILFFPLMLNPTCFAYLEISLVLLCMWSEFGEVKAMSSVNFMSFYIDVLSMVHLIPVLVLSIVFPMTQSIVTRNSNSDMMDHCLTLLVMLNQLLNLFSSITLSLQVLLSNKVLKFLISMLVNAIIFVSEV